MSDNKSTMPVQSLDNLSGTLQALKAIHGTTWRDIAQIEQYQGIPAGTLCAIAKGRNPKNPHYREILRLPVLALAPVCLQCGEVHTTKRCTANDKLGQWQKWVRTLGHAGGEWQ